MQTSPRINRLLLNVRNVNCRWFASSSSPSPAKVYEDTYNDLPQPEGNWKTKYDAYQRVYNVHFVIGLGSLLGTVAFGFAAGMFESYSDIPDQMPEIDCYKVEKSSSDS